MRRASNGDDDDYDDREYQALGAVQSISSNDAHIPRAFVPESSPLPCAVISARSGLGALLE